MLHSLLRSRFVRPREPLQELLALQQVALGHDTEAPDARDRIVDRRTLAGQLATLRERGLVRLDAVGERYELTDAGRVRLQMLTVDLARELASLRHGTLAMFRAMLAQLALGSVQRVVLYPFGETTEIAYEAVTSLGLDVVGIVDDAVEKRGVRFRGLSVQAPEAIATLDIDAVLVTSALFRDVILERVRQLAPASVLIHAI